MLDWLMRRLNKAETLLRVKTGGTWGRMPEQGDDPMAMALAQPKAKVIVQMRVIRADGTIEDLEPGEAVITSGSPDSGR